MGMAYSLEETIRQQMQRERDREITEARQIITDLVEYVECNDPGNPHLARAKGFLSGGEG
jgi:hypothetical protein